MARFILEHMVREWGFEPILASNGVEAWKLLSGDDPPPLVLLDWMMPGLDGLEICRRLRTTTRGSYVRVIMLTARNETSDLVEALNAGADDFIGKPFNKQELCVRLRAGQRIAELEAKLRFQATHDGLTGVLNRTAIFEALEHDLARAGRNHQATAILLADVDHFKRVNDSFGHQAGDLVLREVTRRIKSVIRVFDSLGRYGGEEFLVVLPDCDASQARDIAERIRQAVSRTPIETPCGPVSVTMSVGGSISMAGSTFADALAREADAALYQGKRDGRDCARFAMDVITPSVKSVVQVPA
jgi:diguanylate cyclase (GGDEF)-like protein